MLNLSTHSDLKKVEEVLGQALVTVSFLMYDIPNSFLVEFSGCTNSSANNDFDCFKAIDGNLGHYGWHTKTFPFYGVMLSYADSAHF